MLTINRIVFALLFTTLYLHGMQKNSEWEVIETPVQYPEGLIDRIDKLGDITERYLDGTKVTIYLGNDEITQITYPNGTISYTQKKGSHNPNNLLTMYAKKNAVSTPLTQDNPDYIQLADIPSLAQFAHQLPAGSIIGSILIKDNPEIRTKVIEFANGMHIEQTDCDRERHLFTIHEKAPSLFPNFTKKLAQRYTRAIRITDRIHEPVSLHYVRSHPIIDLFKTEEQRIQEKNK